VFQTSNQELFIQGILLLPGSHHIWIFSVVFAEVLHIRVFEVRKNYAKKKNNFWAQLIGAQLIHSKCLKNE
jgi:hypothetical protein